MKAGILCNIKEWRKSTKTNNNKQLNTKLDILKKDESCKGNIPLCVVLILFCFWLLNIVVEIA
ncbi:hypothetical protein AZ66_22620 [Paenibacillus sp. E194]|nr:hypothetical protein AZ66_22620 [Paenibacillus sp. E194]